MYTNIKHIFFSCVLFPFFLSAQQVITGTIEGYVYDSLTGKPLEAVNVFLNSTTLGSATDQYGKFSIQGIPAGSYQLIISMIGYQSERKTFHIEPGEKIKRDFKLQLHSIELEDIQVEAEVPEEWINQYERFREEFLGQSENAGFCTIQNPEILEFTDEDHFSAFAEDYLHVENRALGYLVSLKLKYFFINHNGEVSYTAISKFNELSPEDSLEKKLWQKNREKAFYGSMRHFYYALAYADLDKQGFAISKTMMPNWSELDRDLEVSDLKLPQLDDTTQRYFESSFYYDGYIRVVYRKEEEESAYVDYRKFYGSKVNQALKKQVSWIKFPYGVIRVNNFGNLVGNLQTPKVFGYWSWERISNALPLDYIPKNFH